MSFLLGLMDGSQIELFRQSFLNIGADTSNGIVTVGRIVSIACLLAFGMLAYLYLKYARLYMLSQEPVVIKAAEPEINVGYVILKEIFEGIRSGQPKKWNIHIYLPLINIVYCFMG